MQRLQRSQIHAPCSFLCQSSGYQSLTTDRFYFPTNSNLKKVNPIFTTHTEIIRRVGGNFRFLMVKNVEFYKKRDYMIKEINICNN